MKPLLHMLALLLLLQGSSGLAQTPPSLTPDQAAVSHGNNAFAFHLYAQLRSRNGNLFFSPESISTALAMAYAEARGTTASQMASTLHFTLPPPAFFARGIHETRLTGRHAIRYSVDIPAASTAAKL